MQSFQECIRDVSYNMGDLILGILTGVGGPGSVTDAGRTESDGHWTGGTLSINGEERPITVSGSTGVFTTNSFLTTPAVGDEYELRKLVGHTRELIKKYLNMGIRDFASVSWVELDSRVDLGDTSVFDAITPALQYAVPEGLDFVHKVLWQYDPTTINVLDTTWYELTASEWWVNAPGYIRLISQQEPIDDATPLDIPDKALLKFLGSRRPRELSTEQQRIDILSPYPILFATARMCLSLSKNNGAEEWKDQFTIFYNDAKAVRERDRKPLRSGSRKVR